MKNLKQINLKGKRVLLRTDFNVPLSPEGVILDDFRIKKTLPTIEYLISKKVRLILLSHLGRPEGRVVEKLRMDPVQKRLSQYLNISIAKTSECLGPEVEKRAGEMKAGEILLLENIRFYKEELKNDDQFARSMAKLADTYINDAFAVCHRNQASVAGLPKYLPSAAGLSLEKEIKVLSKIMKEPKKPLLAIIGGAKVEKAKLKLINKFSERGNLVLVGGLVRKGIEEKRIKLNCPERVIFPLEKITGQDIARETINLFNKEIKKAKTIFWDGVLGKTEEKQFQRGSEEIARAIILSKAFSVVGGGETIGFINRLGLADKFNHLSTGGGAMLAFLAGDRLPGLEALEK